jgi:hypothetical protein
MAKSPPFGLPKSSNRARLGTLAYDNWVGAVVAAVSVATCATAVVSVRRERIKSSLSPRDVVLLR